jgi:hypothetical protein
MKRVSRDRSDDWFDRAANERQINAAEAIVVAGPMGTTMLEPAGERVPPVVIKWAALDTECAFKGPSSSYPLEITRHRYVNRSRRLGRIRD